MYVEISGTWNYAYLSWLYNITKEKQKFIDIAKILQKKQTTTLSDFEEKSLSSSFVTVYWFIQDIRVTEG